MIIKRLSLYNFGVYAGANTFVFSNKKPVVLIGGMNGRGKTTFLNAVLIALYGGNSFAYRESSYNTYGQYLRSFVNAADGSLEASVEIEFKINRDDADTFIVCRNWNAKGKRTKEVIQVKKNNEINTFLSNNWLMFIENILPSALSPYFFFDGDNIADLAVGSTDDKMKNSIKTLLGISVLDQLETDLIRMDNSISKKNSANNDDDKIEALRDAAQQFQDALNDIDQQIEKEQAKLEEIDTKIEKKNADYVAKGGLIVEQRQELFQKRTQLHAELQQLRAMEIELAGSDLPLSLVSGLIEKIYEKTKAENESREVRIAAAKLKELYSDYSNKKSKDIKAFLDYVDSVAWEKSGETGYDYSHEFLYETKGLLEQKLKERRSQTEKIIRDVKKISEKINEADEQLAIDIDEKKVSSIFRDIKKLEQMRIATEELLARLFRQRSEANGRFIRASSEYSHFVEETLSSIELNEEFDRLQSYNYKALQIIKEYKIQLQKRKISVLTDTITDCFKQLSNKRNLISKIVMDYESLEFSYLDAEGQLVPKESLSEGEKQMMIISILWALAKCSKRRLPVIIDTPLARLDSAHRRALVQTYFPKASDQTIILSTDSEIIGEYYNLIKKNVTDEFTLVYDDETKSTHIENGYFEDLQ